MTLRGFFGANLYSSVEATAVTGEDYEGTFQDSTTAGIGSSLTFGDLSVDGSVNVNGTGVFSLNQPMGRVSMTYKF